MGKSTQCNHILELLKSFGIDTILTREPGGSDGADQIRQLLVTGAEDRWDPLAEALLLFAARRDHLTRTIIPALETGIWVVCDRFCDSTVAYQGYGHGMDRKFLNSLNKRVCGDIEPELTIILDAPTQLGLSRALKRGGPEDRYERLMNGFHNRARRGFLEIARAKPSRCTVIDATDEVDAIRTKISKIIVSHFSLERMKTSDQSTLLQY